MPRRYAELEDNTVVNVVIAEQDVADERGWVAIPISVGPGWKTNDGGRTWVEGTPPVTPENRVKNRVAAYMKANRDFINASKPSSPGAQASAAYDAGVQQAQMLNDLARLVMNQVSAED